VLASGSAGNCTFVASENTSLLIDAGLINETQLSAALHSQKTWGGKLGSTLVRMGFVSEAGILKCLSAQLRLPSADFRKLNISPKAIQSIPFNIAEKYNVIPVALKEELGKKTVILAMSDPTNLDTISEIEFQSGVRVRPVVAAESSITKAIDKYYREKNFKTEYGYEKRVDLSAVEEAEEMVILTGGEEHTVSTAEAPEPGKLVRALAKALVDKGVLTEEELEAALRELS
jgi:type IV pilus assembly protein PilB